MSAVRPAATNRHGVRRLLRQLSLPLLLVSSVALAYSNSFRGAFLFDDIHHIIENERIRQWWPPWDLLAVERPVVELSLAVNYALGGLNPWGYHAFNLIVHIFAALTLFGVVRRTIALKAECGMRSAETKAAAPPLSPFRIHCSAIRIAFVVALLWALHPLQTQSVTYVIQRGESLMGLSYLLSLYCTIRGSNATRPMGWYAAAIIACGVGMASKAVMVTAPVVVILYDFVFLGAGTHASTSGSRAGKPTVRWGLYLGLAATWGVLWICDVTGEVLDPQARSSHVGFGYRGITPLEYAATQPGVILKYLRLALWPVGLCLDYDWSVASTLDVIILPAVTIVGLLIATVYGLVRRSWMGFAGAWFFVILAPTSSFIPIKDILFEHRMYLPLASVVAVMVFGLRTLSNLILRPLDPFGKAGAVVQRLVLATVAAVFAYGTYLRNEDYRSDLAIWTDVALKRPYNARARVAWGNALFSRNRVDEAVAAYREAVALRPDFADAYCALGMGLARKGALDEAVAAYRESLRLDPNHARAHYNLGNVLSRKGKVEESIESFRNSLQIEPRFAEAYCNLGNALADQGKVTEAMAAFREALRLKPNLPNAHKNLGDLLVEIGRVDEGMAELVEAIRLQPDYANAHASLAAALLNGGDTESAVRHAREALRLDPEHPTAGDVIIEAAKRGWDSTPGGG